MSFKRIDLGQEKSLETPWLNEWLVSHPDANGGLYQVEKCIFGMKGVLVICEYFQVFLYKSNPYHNFLLEACEHWTSHKEAVQSLTFEVDNKAKILGHLGLNSEVLCDWEKKGQNIYAVTQTGHMSLTSRTPSANPLLASSTAPTSVSKTPRKRGKAEKVQEGGAVDETLEAAISLTEATNGFLRPNEPPY